MHETTTIIPNEQELLSLKSDIEATKRKAEYERLKKDLRAMTYQAVNTPVEFDGVMQSTDTYKALKTRRQGYHFFELLFGRIRGMFALSPIIGNIIALLIAGIVLFTIFNEVDAAGFKGYQSYFVIGIQLFAAIQIIKSATRGLLLPFLALIVGGVMAHGLGGEQTFLHLGKAFYEHLMIVGILGLGVAVLSID